MDAISRKRAELFEEAHEVALLCDAEVALLIISADGERHEFVSSTSSVEEIVTRFKESGINHALESNSEETGENVLMEIDAAELKSRKLIGKDFAEMSSDELTLLERQMYEGVTFIMERKQQLLKEALQQSRLKAQQQSIENQLLERQIEETRKYHLRNFIPPSE